MLTLTYADLRRVHARICSQVAARRHQRYVSLSYQCTSPVIYVYVNVYVYVYVCVYMYVCMYVYICIYTYIHIYIHTYIHTYIQISYALKSQPVVIRGIYILSSEVCVLKLLVCEACPYATSARVIRGIFLGL
jgi:hypothetical protein